jgi:hypothetical protein
MIVAIPAGEFALWGVVCIPLTNTWGVKSVEFCYTAIGEIQALPELGVER